MRRFTTFYHLQCDTLCFRSRLICMKLITTVLHIPVIFYCKLYISFASVVSVTFVTYIVSKTIYIHIAFSITCYHNFYILCRVKPSGKHKTDLTGSRHYVSSIINCYRIQKLSTVSYTAIIEYTSSDNKAGETSTTICLITRNIERP